MKCVSYTRTTSCICGETIPANSITIQNEEIQSFMKKRGWKLDMKYSDRKHDPEEEAAFLKMRMDGIARKFDMVVLGSAFHCGRSVSYAEDLLIKTFLPAGIHFAVAEDEFCSMDHSQQETEKYFCRKRWESNVSYMRHAEREKERQGLFDVHDEKYGYLLNEDFTGFVLDEEVVPIIREIFHLLADNMTMQAVADLLNERGIESPSVHLARVSKKNFRANGSQWVLGSIQRIMQNTAYIGYWTKMVGGEEQTIEIPAIVDKRVFELAGQNVSSRGRKMPDNVMRSNNAFVKQIFDRDSGKALVCRRYTEGGDYQMFHRNWFAISQGIRYETVEESVVLALKEEMRQAQQIAAMLEQREVLAERDRQIAVLARQGREISLQIAEQEKKRLSACRGLTGQVIPEQDIQTAVQDPGSCIHDLDIQFEAVMEKVSVVRKAFSLKNPWITLYKKIVLADKLTKKDMHKWIERIWIKKLETVEVDMRMSEWKAYFLEEWLKEGVNNGKTKPS